MGKIQKKIDNTDIENTEIQDPEVLFRTKFPNFKVYL